MRDTSLLFIPHPFIFTVFYSFDASLFFAHIFCFCVLFFSAIIIICVWVVYDQRRINLWTLVDACWRAATNNKYYQFNGEHGILRRFDKPATERILFRLQRIFFSENKNNKNNKWTKSAIDVDRRAASDSRHITVTMTNIENRSFIHRLRSAQQQANLLHCFVCTVFVWLSTHSPRLSRTQMPYIKYNLFCVILPLNNTCQ